ncbi:MAG: AMP phosphorylase [Thermoplasmata archaeon]
MKVKTVKIEIRTGRSKIIAVGEQFGKELDLHPMDRVQLVKDDKKVIATVDFWTEIKEKNAIGVFEEVWQALQLKEGDMVEIKPMEKPTSIEHIIAKMNGEELSEKQYVSIVDDIVEDRLTDIEITAFISAVYMNGTTTNEAYYLTKSIAEKGERLNFGDEIIADKHCSGGVPGNRTTMVVVPIIAALGIKIPKCSSRAITSPAGTADTMEVLAKVDLPASRIKEIVNKVNGCIVWGGGLNIAPADDKMIKVRKPLSLDPEGLLLASILAKKYAMGSTHVLFDLPVGQETKHKSIGEARHLERQFITLGRKLGMNIAVILTDGNEPIGQGVGPALECVDVLKVLMNRPDAPADLKDKGLMMAGKLIELIGIEKFKKDGREGDGYYIAKEVLESGKAWKKMQEIIKEQEGDPDITPEKIRIGKYTKEIRAPKSGKVFGVKNKLLAKVARIAGAPETKSAGVFLSAVYGKNVKQGDLLATIYAESPEKAERAFAIQDGKELFEII